MSAIQICLCSRQCSFYGDCSACINLNDNNQNFRKEFTCTMTAFDGAIYMKTMCPPSSNHSAVIKENCESVNTTLQSVDSLLSTPVTNTKEKITYKNIFCALCHNENDFQFWNIGFVVELCSDMKSNKPDSSIDVQNAFEINTMFKSFPYDIPTSKFTGILENLTINNTDDNLWFWMSTFDNQSYKCSINAILPKNLIESVRFCQPSMNDNRITERAYLTLLSANCSQNVSYLYFGKRVSQPDVELTIQDENIPKVNHCSEIPSTHNSFKLFCKTREAEESKSQSSNRCIFRRPDTNDVCLLAQYFANTEIEFRHNNRIYLKSNKIEYPPEEWDTDRDRPNETFICGTYKSIMYSNNIFEILDDLITSVLSLLSIFCLILYLFINHQISTTINLPSKNLNALGVTLLVVYSCLQLGPPLHCCKISAVILHYALLSCFVWTFVMSYDCWRSLYFESNRFRTPSKHHVTRFITYCIISWLAPLIIIGFSLYLELSPSDVVSCKFKPLYGVSTDCFIFGQSAHFLLFILPAFVIFIGNISFFGHTVYTVHCFQHKRMAINQESRYSYQLYIKIALLMGLNWTLGILVYYTSGTLKQYISLLFSLLNMSLGIVFFFMFTLTKRDEIRTMVNQSKSNRFLKLILWISVKMDDSVYVLSKSRLKFQRTNETFV